MAEVEVVRDDEGKALHGVYQKMYTQLNKFLGKTEHDALYFRGKKYKVAELYKYDMGEVIKLFAMDNRVPNKKTFRAIVGLGELLNHLNSRIVKIKRGSDTCFLDTGKQLLISCRESSEQLRQKVSLNDRLDAIFEGGEVRQVTLGAISGENVHLNLKPRDHDSFIENRLSHLSMKQTDSPCCEILQVLETIDQSKIDFIFPSGKLAITPYEKRKNWKIDYQNFDSSQQEALKGMLLFNHLQPILLHGISGSGKSKCLVKLVQVMLQNLPKFKCVIISANNSAIDSLLDKIIQLDRKVKLVRLVSKQHQEKLPNSLCGSETNTVDVEVAMRKFAEAHILGTTVCKLAKVQENHNYQVDLIIIDEASAVSEATAVAAVHTFLKPGHTNFVLAGDTLQQGPMCLSQLAQDFGLQRSTMHRLYVFDDAYANDAIDYAGRRSYYKLNRNYRNPTPIATKLFALFYDGNEISKPDPTRANKYANLEGFPPGNILYYDVRGQMNQYTNLSGSISNEKEVKKLLDCIDTIVIRNKVPPEDVMVVTLYYKQGCLVEYGLQCMKVKTTKRLGGDGGILILTPVLVQGLEAPITILTISQSHNRKIGSYLRDPAQLLVVLSRCSSLLILIGDFRVLQQHEAWKVFCLGADNYPEK